MLTIILLGAVLFQLIFNIITGGGTGMEDMASSGMYSASTLDSIVTGLLVLLVKLLFVALILSLLLAIFLWIKKNFMGNINLTRYVQQNPMIKSVLGITAVLIGLVFLIYIYNYLLYPASGASGDMAHSSASNSMSGFSGTLGITGVLFFLIKVLTYVFVISLILGLMAYVKKLMEAGGFHIFGVAGSSAGKEADKTEPKVEDNPE